MKKEVDALSIPPYKKGGKRKKGNSISPSLLVRPKKKAIPLEG